LTVYHIGYELQGMNPIEIYMEPGVGRHDYVWKACYSCDKVYITLQSTDGDFNLYVTERTPDFNPGTVAFL